MATQVEKLPGQPISSDLVASARNKRPITAIHADAICKWLSQQYGREISPADTDLKIHAASSLPASAADTKEGQQEMLAYLESRGYQITAPTLQPEPMYQEGDYLAGDLAPRNWKALANRRVPWPAGMDPATALHELAPFMTYRLLVAEAASMSRDISSFVRPDEQV